MSNNTFSSKRLVLLFKQHFIHNATFLLLSTVAYVGLTFIVLCIVQVGNDLRPHDLNNFQGFLAVLVPVFAILYVGHAFPAFRSKESTITYLMVPASPLEKFIVEFLSRIGLVLLTLPPLYWITFHLQGYLFGIFTAETFEPVGIPYLLKIDEDVPSLIYAVVIGGALLALSLAFTGAAMFTKQPLVKSLFAVALVVMFFVGYTYIVVEHLGLGRYNPPQDMLLIPLEEISALRGVAVLLFVTVIVMLFVAFRKLKEREV